MSCFNNEKFYLICFSANDPNKKLFFETFIPHLLFQCSCHEKIKIKNISEKGWFLVLTLWIVSSKLCCGPPPFIWNGLSLSAAVCIRYEGVKNRRKKTKPEMRNRNCYRITGTPTTKSAQFALTAKFIHHLSSDSIDRRVHAVKMFKQR